MSRAELKKFVQKKFVRIFCSLPIASSDPNSGLDPLFRPGAFLGMISISPRFWATNRPIFRPLFFWTWNFWCKYWCKKVEIFTSFAPNLVQFFEYLHQIGAKTWCKKIQFCTIFVPHILWISCILQHFQIY